MTVDAACTAALPTRLVVAFSLLACHAAFAQPAFEPVAKDEPQRQLVQQIEAIQARDGVNAEGLIVPFSELARSYEQGGDYALAVAALDRAVQLIRVNRGINSLQPAALMQQAIRNENARGDIQAVWDREEDLLRLAERHPEDLRAAPIFRAVADRRMALFALGEVGWQARFPADYCDPLAPRGCLWRALYDARVSYGAAAEVLLRNEVYSSSELRELEMELVHIADVVREQEELYARRGQSLYRVGYLPRRREQIWVDPEVVKVWGVADRLDYLAPGGAGGKPDAVQGEPTAVLLPGPTGYEFGRRSLVRLYKYAVASAAPAVQQVEAIVQLADWDLRFSRNSLALEGYEQARAFLEKTGEQATIEALFSPPTPVVLPAYAPNPLASEATNGSTDYIDVVFTITELGEPRRIKILDTTTTSATDAAKDRLVTLIKSSRFRPRVNHGELAASPVRVRYYPNEIRSEEPASTDSGG